MSAFDDEFGLFGEDADDSERRSTLGARKIATGGETIIDEIEPEDERPRRTQPRDRAPGGGGNRERSYAPRRERAPNADPWAGYRRATDVLGFLARKLVQKPDAVAVELFTDEQGKPVIELVVDPEDLGKVIGRSGRVAHALRTVVRATAEGRVSVDILDSEEAAEGPEDEEEQTTDES
jgi:predicted RNA-binding protein YlqC (UPF0109 family)